jgi:adenine deaminase
MATAINKLIDIQAGTVIVRNGRVIFEFPMPVFGTMPIGTIDEIATRQRKWRERSVR